MKRIIASLLLLALLLSLVACGGTPSSTALPEGMRLVTEEDGYTFYAPEDWTVDTSTGVPTAYVSAIDPSSITLVRVATDLSPIDYFTASLDSLAATLSDFALDEEASDDNTTLGGKGAIVRVYRGKVLDTPYAFKQYLCKVDGYLYLFTYTAMDTVPSGSKTYFERYEEKADAAAAALAFTGTKGETVSKDEPPVTNADGLVLISDPAISRYSLYVPATWQADLKNGTTSATREGAMLSVTYEIPKEENIEAYWEAKNTAYASLYPGYTPLRDEWTAPVENREEVTCWLGDRQAVRRAFTYTQAGVTYKTTRYLTVDGIYVYTLSYTAVFTGDGSDAYTAYYPDFLAVAAAFSFK